MQIKSILIITLLLQIPYFTSAQEGDEEKQKGIEELKLEILLLKKKKLELEQKILKEDLKEASKKAGNSAGKELKKSDIRQSGDHSLGIYGGYSFTKPYTLNSKARGEILDFGILSYSTRKNIFTSGLKMEFAANTLIKPGDVNVGYARLGYLAGGRIKLGNVSVIPYGSVGLGVMATLIAYEKAQEDNDSDEYYHRPADESSYMDDNSEWDFKTRDGRLFLYGEAGFLFSVITGRYLSLGINPYYFYTFGTKLDHSVGVNLLLQLGKNRI